MAEFSCRLCSYTCNPGYSFNDASNSASKTITCGSDGQWSTLTHQCVCKHSYRCNSSPNPHLHALFPVTHCVNTDLTALVPSASNLAFDATVNGGKTLLNERLTINCTDPNAKLESDESKTSVEILCNAQGQFEPPSPWPVCATEVQCPDPSPKTGTTFTISGTGYTAGGAVKNGHVAR